MVFSRSHFRRNTCIVRYLKYNLNSWIWIHPIPFHLTSGFKFKYRFWRRCDSWSSHFSHWQESHERYTVHCASAMIRDSDSLFAEKLKTAHFPTSMGIMWWYNQKTHLTHALSWKYLLSYQQILFYKNILSPSYQHLHPWCKRWKLSV